MNSLPSRPIDHDALRDGGLRSLAQDATVAHPLERLQKEGPRATWRMRKLTAERLFGAHASLRMEMERQMMAQCQRLPGLPSSMVGLETLMGDDETIEMADVIGLREHDPEYKVDLHRTMEARMGLRL